MWFNPIWPVIWVIGWNYFGSFIPKVGLAILNQNEGPRVQFWPITPKFRHFTTFQLRKLTFFGLLWDYRLIFDQSGQGRVPKFPKKKSFEGLATPSFRPQFRYLANSAWNSWWEFVFWAILLAFLTWGSAGLLDGCMGELVIWTIPWSSMNWLKVAAE